MLILLHRSKAICLLPLAKAWLKVVGELVRTLPHHSRVIDLLLPVKVWLREAVREAAGMGVQVRVVPAVNVYAPTVELL